MRRALFPIGLALGVLAVTSVYVFSLSGQRELAQVLSCQPEGTGCWSDADCGPVSCGHECTNVVPGVSQGQCTPLPPGAGFCSYGEGEPCPPGMTLAPHGGTCWAAPGASCDYDCETDDSPTTVAPGSCQIVFDTQGDVNPWDSAIITCNCSNLTAASSSAPGGGPVCGNNILEAGEECEINIECPDGDPCVMNGCYCDNGVASSPPSISSSKSSAAPPAVCGNGTKEGTEQCDDGNTNNNDACTNACKNAVCGDTIVRTGVEQCDDGNANQNDACKNNCTLNVCGDGQVRSGVEQCDDGAGNLSCGPMTSTWCKAGTCALPACSDGIDNDGDGFVDGGDGGCYQYAQTPPQCPSGPVTLGTLLGQAAPVLLPGRDNETCPPGLVDVGNNCIVQVVGGSSSGGAASSVSNAASSVSQQASSPQASSPPTSVASNSAPCPTCFNSNGSTASNNSQGGSSAAPQGSSAPRVQCTTDADCGTPLCRSCALNGAGSCVQACNACVNNACVKQEIACHPDRCRVASSLSSTSSTGPRCGNGITEVGEQCDDGNTSPNDGCSQFCEREFCGDGVLQFGEQCDCGRGEVDPANPLATSCWGNVQAVDRNGRPITPSASTAMATIGFPRCISCVQQFTCAANSNTFTLPNSCIGGFRAGMQTNTPANVSVMTYPLSSSCYPPYLAACTNQLAPFCGDGTVQSANGETCDLGSVCSASGGSCNTGAQQAACGLAGGTCQRVDSASCRSCQLITPCGNGTTDPGEQCDDGNRYDNDGCSASCRREYCGDGIMQNTTARIGGAMNEDCDPGLTCRDGSTCDPAVGCSDGTECAFRCSPSLQCNPTCTVSQCGNGTVECGEQCEPQVEHVCASRPSVKCNPLVANSCPMASAGSCVNFACTNAPLSCNYDSDCDVPDRCVEQLANPGFVCSGDSALSCNPRNSVLVRHSGGGWDYGECVWQDECLDTGICSRSGLPCTRTPWCPNGMPGCTLQNTALFWNDCPGFAAGACIRNPDTEPACGLDCQRIVTQPPPQCSADADCPTNECCKPDGSGGNKCAPCNQCTSDVDCSATGQCCGPGGSCTACSERCGNGVKESTEECDEGSVCTYRYTEPQADGSVLATEVTGGSCLSSADCENTCVGAYSNPASPYGSCSTTGQQCLLDSDCATASCQLQPSDTCRANCTIPVCGDRVIDTNEQCDLGDLSVLSANTSVPSRNLVGWLSRFYAQLSGSPQQSGNVRGPFNSDAPDAACRTDCTLPRCGDNIVDSKAGETCDLGDAPEADWKAAGCDINSCTSDVCGDGIVNKATEECDDGEDNSDLGGTCTSTCTVPRCGDGITDPSLYVDNGVPPGAVGSYTEQCDCGDTGTCYVLSDGSKGDGTEPDARKCSQCKLSYCGDGRRDFSMGEFCDAAGMNSDDPDALCRLDCTVRRCGDAIVDTAFGEQCDDGAQCADGSACDCYAGSGWTGGPTCCSDGSKCEPRYDPAKGDTCTAGCRTMGTNNSSGNKNSAGNSASGGNNSASGGNNSASAGNSASGGNNSASGGSNSASTGNSASGGNKSASAGNSASGGGSSGVPPPPQGVCCESGFCNPFGTCAAPFSNYGACLAACGTGGGSSVSRSASALSVSKSSSGNVSCTTDVDCIAAASCAEQCSINSAGQCVRSCPTACVSGRCVAQESPCNPSECSNACPSESVCTTQAACDETNGNSIGACGAGNVCCVTQTQCPAGDRCLLSQDCEVEGGTVTGVCGGPLSETVCCRIASGSAGSSASGGRALCGNGTVDTGEACDAGDKNGVWQYAGEIAYMLCNADCSAPRCGDGNVNRGTFRSDIYGGEQCDDGNTKDSDGCSTSCKREYCGDGKTQVLFGEECDDGNSTGEDGCSLRCEREYCGDGIPQIGLGEECDNGLANDDTKPDGCRESCKKAFCGDGVTDSDEQCDDGNTIDTDACSNACSINRTVGSASSAAVSGGSSAGNPNPFCGDGICQQEEKEIICPSCAVDQNGDPIGNCACFVRCEQDCSLCGDGKKDVVLGEECDDGNLENGDGCSMQCKLESGSQQCNACQSCGEGLGNFCDVQECLSLGACVADENFFFTTCIPDPLRCTGTPCVSDVDCPAEHRCIQGNCVPNGTSRSSASSGGLSDSSSTFDTSFSSGQSIPSSTSSRSASSGGSVYECEQCALCGNGLFNLCDAAECASIGPCVFDTTFFGGVCLPEPLRCSQGGSSASSISLVLPSSATRSVACLNDFQCAIGQTCQNGFCVGGSSAGSTASVACLSDAQCPAASLCINGQCHAQFACISDTQCPIGACVDGACVPSVTATRCTAHADCDTGRCVQGVCLDRVLIAALPSFCGNGRTDSGEICDDGAANADRPNALCRPDCSLRRCGDGIVDTQTEQCDDGNLQDQDGCSARCTEEHQAAGGEQGSILTLPFLPRASAPSRSCTSHTECAANEQCFEGRCTASGTNSSMLTGTPVPPSQPASGPATVAIMAAGAAAGIGLVRRRRRRLS